MIWGSWLPWWVAQLKRPRILDMVTFRLVTVRLYKGNLLEHWLLGSLQEMHPTSRIKALMAESSWTAPSNRKSQIRVLILTLELIWKERRCKRSRWCLYRIRSSLADTSINPSELAEDRGISTGRLKYRALYKLKNRSLTNHSLGLNHIDMITNNSFKRAQLFSRIKSRGVTSKWGASPQEKAS